MNKTIIGVLSLAVVVSLTASRASSPTEGEYAPIPWHLVDLWWEVKKDVALESYSVDVELSDDVSPESNLFIVPFYGQLNDQSAYAGILTSLQGYTLKDREPRDVGRGGIFRRWGERGHENTRPPAGGYFLDSDHEGDLVDVSMPYGWKKGKYTLKLVKMDTERRRETPYVWVGAFLYSHETDENVFIGALRFKGEGLRLSRSFAMFVELYRKPVPVEDIPPVVVKLSNVQLNGDRLENPVITANYPPKVPDCADVKRGEGDAVAVAISPVEEKRSKRMVELPIEKGEISVRESRKAREKPADHKNTTMQLQGAPDKEGGKVSDKFYDSYFAAGGARAGGDRCAVIFWNLSGKDVTLTVDNESRPLPAGQSLRRELKRDFAWRVAGRDEQRQQVPAQESGIEIVIRR